MTLTTPLIVHTLPFFDVEVTSQLPHMGRAFTDVQELKQAYTSALWLMFFFCALIVIQNKNIFPWGRRRNVDLASNHAQFSPSHSLHLHHRRPSRVRWVACTCCFGGVVVHGIGKDSSKSYYNIIVKNDTFVGWRDFQNFVIHWPWKITVQCSTYSLSLHSCEEIPQ